MPEHREQDTLVHLIAELQEEAAIEAVQEMINAGENPLKIIDLCHKGLSEVGSRYEQEVFFISGLIMAGEIMRQVSKMLFPLLENRNFGGTVGNIVLGSVEGDIHFIGKDIFKTLARVNGFTVHDLGVDVSPEKFLAAVHEFKPKIVGLSCLITAAYGPMEETIKLLRENARGSVAPYAYIIGGRVDGILCDQVNADYWANNAMEGVRQCQQIMQLSG